MPQDTTARSAYVHMAIRTAAVYTAERRIRRVGGPPVYVDIPGVYEVDPDFQDTQQTTGELALLGIVASLAKKDVTIRKLKRKIELLEDIIERTEVEEVEDLCGVDDGSTDERSDTWEVWEQESGEATPSSSEAGTPSPPASGTQKRVNRNRNIRTGLTDERGFKSLEGSPDAEEEGGQPGPSTRLYRRAGRTDYHMVTRMRRTRRGDTPYPSSDGESSSSHSDGTRTPRDPTSVPVGENCVPDRA